MKNNTRFFSLPIVKVFFSGCLKMLVIIPITSLLLIIPVVFYMYGVDFDKYLRPFGTASDFFVFGVGFVILWSIPVALLTIINLSFFLRYDGRKKNIGYKRTFWVGLVSGGLIGGGEALFMTSLLGSKIMILYVMFFASIAGGIGGLWMTQDALKLYGD